MRPAAHVSCHELTVLMNRLPEYRQYVSRRRARHGEREFRRALGRLLKHCGDHLLDIAERRAQYLNSEQEQVLDGIVDAIGAIFRRLDREGPITLVGGSKHTIDELEELDTRLLLLVEEALALTRRLNADPPMSVWFQREAQLLCEDLEEFSQTTEERNFLLGLGWESEFSIPRRS